MQLSVFWIISLKSKRLICNDLSAKGHSCRGKCFVLPFIMGFRGFLGTLWSTCTWFWRPAEKFHVAVSVWPSRGCPWCQDHSTEHPGHAGWGSTGNSSAWEIMWLNPLLQHRASPWEHSQMVGRNKPSKDQAVKYWRVHSGCQLWGKQHSLVWFVIFSSPLKAK